MRIGELASHAGVRVSTIRYYERAGVLEPPERTTGGYRDYDDESLRYLRFLKRGQELGFTLGELGEFVGYSTQTRRGVIDHATVASIAAGKLQDLDARIADLQRTRSAITNLMSASCIDPDAPCPIISALADPVPTHD